MASLAAGLAAFEDSASDRGLTKIQSEELPSVLGIVCAAQDKWWHTSQRVLIIRPEMWDLMKVVEHHRTSNRSIVLTGTPGVGKHPYRWQLRTRGDIMPTCTV